VLLEFRRSPKPIPACVHILQHSRVPDAAFQAALTLREAALEGWALLGGHERTDLRQWVLQYVHGALSSQEAALRPMVATLCGAYASLIKRGWLELDDAQRQAVFRVGGVQKVDVVDRTRGSTVASTRSHPSFRPPTLPQESCALAGDQRDTVKVCLGLRLLAALIAEFCPPTSSRLAMSWAFHADCGTSFELLCLVPAYQTALGIAAASASLAATHPAHAAMCRCVHSGHARHA